jgi:hypothetical protein
LIAHSRKSPLTPFPKRGNSYWKGVEFSAPPNDAKFSLHFLDSSPFERGKQGDFEFFHIF